MEMLPYTVLKQMHYDEGMAEVLGEFDTEQEANDFIGSLDPDEHKNCSFSVEPPMSAGCHDDR